VLRIGISWGYELAAFWAVILVFFAMPHNLFLNEDLRVGIIYDALKGIPKKVIDLIHYIGFCVVIYGMTIAFYQFVTLLGHVEQNATHFPNWFFFGAIGIGVGISILELIAQIIDLFVEKKPASSVPESNEQKVIEGGVS
jgi:TRAP-type C4-dicarboxylate transport system permease small subunit